jgi:hypothetical protein
VYGRQPARFAVSLLFQKWIYKQGALGSQLSVIWATDVVIGLASFTLFHASWFLNLPSWQDTDSTS